MIRDPRGNWVDRILNVGDTFVPAVLLALFLIWGARILVRPGGNKEGDPLSGWALGAWLCAILTYPVMSHPNVISRASVVQSQMGDGFLKLLERNMDLLVPYLFTGSFKGDRHDFSFQDDSLFSFAGLLALVMALAALAAVKPDRNRVLLLLAALLGLVPYVMVPGPYAARLMGFVPPVLVLGAFGLDRLWRALEGAAGKRWVGRLLGALTVCGFGAASWMILERCHHQWLEGNVVSRGPYAYAKMIPDQDAGRRVYVGQPLNNPGQEVIQERRPVQVWQESNLLYLHPGETVPDMVLFTTPSDRSARQAIEAAFPDARWDEFWDPEVTRGEAALLRCFIPGERIPEVPEGVRPVLGVRRVEPPTWMRRFTRGYSGFADGLRYNVDRVREVGVPIPPYRGSDHPTIAYTGTIRVDREGKYEFAVKTDNPTRLWVDGDLLLHVTFAAGARYYLPSMAEEGASKRLKAGDHQVRVETIQYKTRTPPEIRLGL
jgi:hypothetical protein